MENADSEGEFVMDDVTNYFLQLGIMAILLSFSGFVTGRYLFPHNRKNNEHNADSDKTCTCGSKR